LICKLRVQVDCEDDEVFVFRWISWHGKSCK